MASDRPKQPLWDALLLQNHATFNAQVALWANTKSITGVSYERRDWSNHRLINFHFVRCKFKFVRFGSIENCKFINCEFVECSFIPPMATLSSRNSAASVSRGLLLNSSFLDCKLSAATFANYTLDNAVFYEVAFNGVRIDECSIRTRFVIRKCSGLSTLYPMHAMLCEDGAAIDFELKHNTLTKSEQLFHWHNIKPLAALPLLSFSYFSIFTLFIVFSVVDLFKQSVAALESKAQEIANNVLHASNLSAASDVTRLFIHNLLATLADGLSPGWRYSMMLVGLVALLCATAIQTAAMPPLLKEFSVSTLQYQFRLRSIQYVPLFFKSRGACITSFLFYALAVIFLLIVGGERLVKFITIVFS